jgi:hypothetical protein
LGDAYVACRCIIGLLRELERLRKASQYLLLAEDRNRTRDSCSDLLRLLCKCCLESIIEEEERTFCPVKAHLKGVITSLLAFFPLPPAFRCATRSLRESRISFSPSLSVLPGGEGEKAEEGREERMEVQAVRTSSVVWEGHG